MLFQRHKHFKFIAAVLGILATGVPMFLFNAWLGKQGEDDSSVTAQWTIATAEHQIGEAVALLRDLSHRGIDNCGPTAIEAMRQQVLLSGRVKEVMLIGPNGQVECTDAGLAQGHRDVLASARTSEPEIMLDVLRISEPGARFLRIRKTSAVGKPSLAALVPAIALLPHSTLQSGRMLGFARLMLADGTLIGSTGTTPESDHEQPGQNATQARSAKYGFTVAVSMERRGVIADYDDLRRIGMVVTGVVALIILSFALIFPWRSGGSQVTDIAKAVLADEFVPYYQPVVDIQSGRLLGAEVLVRWRRPNGTIVEPGAFIPLMESNGLILDLTRSLMRRVRKEMGEALGRRRNMSIAFNVAPQHFDDALILNDVGSIFDGSPIRLSQIVLELTERYEVENLTSTRRVVAALQGLGCKVAIDDLGTGHSGLSYILKLGVDIIKIDKIFVEAIGSEGHSKAIIETLIDLARNMRMEIIAEGVETFDQVTYLREHGIRAAQGYVFAPPLPAESFLQLLEAMDPIAAEPSEKIDGLVGELAAMKRAAA